MATRVQQAYNKAAMFMCAMGFSGGFLPKSNPHSDYMLAVTLGAGAIFATILAYLGCVASQAPPLLLSPTHPPLTRTTTSPVQVPVRYRPQGRRDFGHA